MLMFKQVINCIRDNISRDIGRSNTANNGKNTELPRTIHIVLYYALS